MRSLTCQFLIAAVMLTRTCLAGTPGATAVDVVKWMFEKAPAQSESQRKAYVESVFDIDRIAASIQAEAARRLRPGLVSAQDARDFIYYITTQVTGGTGQVRILGTVTNQLEAMTSVVVQFTTISTGPRLDAKARADLRALYRLDPIAARELLARKRPSIPSAARQSADSLIDYIESSAPHGDPVEHEYEFLLDTQTGQVLDKKVLWREGAPRQSIFLKYVDNIEAYLHGDRSE